MTRPRSDPQNVHAGSPDEPHLPAFSLEAYLPQVINMAAATLNDRLARELKTIDLPLAHWRILAILAWKGRPCTLSDIR